MEIARVFDGIRPFLGQAWQTSSGSIESLDAQAVAASPVQEIAGDYHPAFWDMQDVGAVADRVARSRKVQREQPGPDHGCRRAGSAQFPVDLHPISSATPVCLQISLEAPACEELTLCGSRQAQRQVVRTG